MQTPATRQGSKQATDAHVPRETTRASTKLGITRPLLQRRSGNRFRLSRRELSSPTKLDGAGVAQTQLLQPSGQRRTLCGVGTAATVFRRASRGLQITALVFFTREEKMHHA
jgi:hypothetical protein